MKPCTVVQQVITLISSLCQLEGMLIREITMWCFAEIKTCTSRAIVCHIGCLFLHLNVDFETISASLFLPALVSTEQKQRLRLL